jgi:chromatin remodeling complex protein RSC6
MAILKPYACLGRTARGGVLINDQRGRYGDIDMTRSSEQRGKKETHAAEKKGEATSKPRAGARGGIGAPVTPSADLAEIVGKDDLPRSEVISKVWEYIKKHNLQDAKDKRQINADDKLAKIFGKQSASMFEMNKYLGAHLKAKKG